MKNNNYILHLIFVCLSLVVITSCSGGGGGGTPTDPNTVFSVFPPNYFVNYNKTINISGKDTDGDAWTATVSDQTLAQTTFLGTPAIPIQSQITLTHVPSGAFAVVTGNTYFTTAANDRHVIGIDGDTTTVSATTTAIPETAKIGDFGIVGSYTDNAGDVVDMSWRIDDGFNGKAKLVLLFNFEDQFGNFDGSEIDTYTIDENGNVLSLHVVIFDPGLGITITMSGS